MKLKYGNRRSFGKFRRKSGVYCAVTFFVLFLVKFMPESNPAGAPPPGGYGPYQPGYGYQPGQPIPAVAEPAPATKPPK